MIVELSNHFAKMDDVEVSIVVLTKNAKFYQIDPRVTVYEPDFQYSDYSRPIFTIKTFLYLRSLLRRQNPCSILSFGALYNSFVLVSSIGLKTSLYISDRGKPGKEYGIFSAINSLLYRFSKGIIAQTEIAKRFHVAKHGQINTKVIGNPIRAINCQSIKRKRILNVGRFIKTKNQIELIKLFCDLEDDEWSLVFVGDGPNLDSVKDFADSSVKSNRIEFMGVQHDIDKIYCECEIFAFTSLSEGFPNALGEAMAAGLACIAYDCVAGPSDLILHGVNGLLIEENAYDVYLANLKQLVQNPSLRNQLGSSAKESMKKFAAEAIAMEYLDFMTSKKSETSNKYSHHT